MDIAERAARDINLILTLDAKCKQQADEIERLREALKAIATGDGVYGRQAYEYKEIARSALQQKETD